MPADEIDIFDPATLPVVVDPDALPKLGNRPREWYLAQILAALLHGQISGGGGSMASQVEGKFGLGDPSNPINPVLMGAATGATALFPLQIQAETGELRASRFPRTLDGGSAYINSKIISATPTIIHSIFAFNKGGADRFLMLYNQDTVPADGAGVANAYFPPVPLPAGSLVIVPITVPIWFDIAAVAVISETAPDILKTVDNPVFLQYQKGNGNAPL